MYNKVIMMGRIANDLELKTTPQGVSVCTFRIAVDRRYQAKGEEKKSDFSTLSLGEVTRNLSRNTFQRDVRFWLRANFRRAAIRIKTEIPRHGMRSSRTDCASRESLSPKQKVLRRLFRPLHRTAALPRKSEIIPRLNKPTMIIPFNIGMIGAASCRT